MDISKLVTGVWFDRTPVVTVTEEDIMNDRLKVLVKFPYQTDDEFIAVICQDARVEFRIDDSLTFPLVEIKGQELTPHAYGGPAGLFEYLGYVVHTIYQVPIPKVGETALAYVVEGGHYETVLGDLAQLPDGTWTLPKGEPGSALD